MSTFERNARSPPVRLRATGGFFFIYLAISSRDVRNIVNILVI